MRDDANKGFWQRFARWYGPFMEHSGGLYEDICQQLRPRLRRDMEVLELACGSGQLSYPLCTSVRRWEATDFSQAMIAQACKKRPPDCLRFSVQDATDLPYEANSFDAVVIANALHIMPHPEKALSEIKRVLKPDGLLFAPTFLHRESTKVRLRTGLLALLGFHAYHKWNAGDLLDFVSQQGFRVERYSILGTSLVPLCCLEAVKLPQE